MKRTVLAWALFLLVLSIPNAILGVAAMYGSRADGERLSAGFFQRRVDAAASLRRELELSLLRGAETLRSIPGTATREDAMAAIASAPNGLQVGFVLHKGVITIPVASDGSTPAADLTLRDKALATLKDGAIAATLMSTPFTSNRDEVRYVRARALVLTVRDVAPGLRVGWLLDKDTLMHGAETLLPRLPVEAISTDLALEPATRPKPQDTDPDVALEADRLWLQLPPPPQGDDARAVLLSNIPMKPATIATPEDATLVTVGRALVFRVVLRDPAVVARSIAERRLSYLGMSLASLLLIDVLAVVLFRRARRAQHLADLRTDFVAAVSHELRTPLASVRMFAELLESGAVKEDDRTEVERTLAGETRRLHATLDRMLRFGALARGKLVAAKAVQRIAPILQQAAAKRAVALDVDSALEGYVDEELLRLAVDNLLSNADKYAPATEPHLVRARREGNDVVIDVIDHGPGLSPNALKKVFLPYERADHRLSRATEGSGVGLALVRGIARAHGGDASASSVLGSGATFTLRLPCC